MKSPKCVRDVAIARDSYAARFARKVPGIGGVNAEFQIDGLDGWWNLKWKKWRWCESVRKRILWIRRQVFVSWTRKFRL